MSSAGFQINEALSIGRSLRLLKRSLRSQRIPIKRIGIGTFIFPMTNVFGMAHATIGIRHVFFRIQTIEVFPSQDHLEEMPANAVASFEIMESILRKRFGNPDQEDGSLENFDKHCIWHGNGIMVTHSLFERFLVEEHLHVCFSKTSSVRR